MAAPLVSGILGMILSKKPDMTYTEAKDRLINNSIQNYSLSIYARGGRVDAYKSLP